MAKTLRILPLLLLLSSCASADRKLCADAAASYTYYEWRYEQECVDEYRQGCHKTYLILKDMKKQVEICNSVQKIGKMPDVQKRELKKVQDDVDNLGW